MEKLVKTLRKEFARNKTKSLVLALISVVAVYFWAPLLSTWTFGESEGGAGPAGAQHAVEAQDVPVQAIVLPPPAASPGPSAVAQTGLASWSELLQRRRQDALTRSVAYDQRLGNPFNQGARLSEDDEEPNDDSPVVAPDHPTDLGLRLAGTMLGRIRTATINNKTYRQSDHVVVGSGPQAVEYCLAEVHRRHVILHRDGERFPLSMEESGLNGGSMIRRSDSDD